LRAKRLGQSHIPRDSACRKNAHGDGENSAQQILQSGNAPSGALQNVVALPYDNLA